MPARQARSDREPGRATRLRPFLLGELLVVFVLVFAYDHIRDLARMRDDDAVRDARALLDVERFAHVDIEKLLNGWLTAHHGLAEVASWYYQLLHFTVTLLVLAACYVRRPHAYRSARNALVAISGAGLVVFWSFPVAPPRLLPGDGFLDTTVLTGVAAHVESTSATNPYAAMPSLHVAWAAWAAVVALWLTRSRWLRVLWVLYPGTTGLVVIGTGNHYVLDVLAGMAVAVAAIACTRTTGWPAAPVELGDAWRWTPQTMPSPRGGDAPRDIAGVARIARAARPPAVDEIGSLPPWHG